MTVKILTDENSFALYMNRKELRALQAMSSLYILGLTKEEHEIQLLLKKLIDSVLGE